LWVFLVARFEFYIRMKAGLFEAFPQDMEGRLQANKPWSFQLKRHLGFFSLVD
jgi:hypothetical protein